MPTNVHECLFVYLFFIFINPFYMKVLYFSAK